jgi:hypothetical protein
MKKIKYSKNNILIILTFVLKNAKQLVILYSKKIEENLKKVIILSFS